MRIDTVEYTISAAGIDHFQIVGRYFRLMETLSPINVHFGVRGAVAGRELEQVEAGAWAKLAEGEESFDLITIEGTAGESVKFVVTDGEAGYDRLFTAIAQANTMTLPGNVTVGTSEGAVLAAGSRRKVIFQADSANAGVIALGPVGVLLTNSPVILSPGDMWIEEVAASAAWRGIASVAGQTLRVLHAS